MTLLTHGIYSMRRFERISQNRTVYVVEGIVSAERSRTSDPTHVAPYLGTGIIGIVMVERHLGFTAAYEFKTVEVLAVTARSIQRERAPSLDPAYRCNGGLCLLVLVGIAERIESVGTEPAMLVPTLDIEESLT